MTMSLIETVTVGSGGAASIEFTGIPQDGKDLLILHSLRFAGTGDGEQYAVTINNNSGSIYTWLRLAGSGNNAFSNGASGTAFAYIYANEGGSTANTFGNTSMYFSNYASSSNKSVSLDGIVANNAVGGSQNLWAGTAADTNPITSIEIFDSNDLLEHSTASLYIIS